VSARDPVRAIADAVLYEGYVLWPYRRSALKNHRRWTFGCVLPRAWSAEHPDDPWRMRSQCLLEGPPDAQVDVTVRFLHVVWRQAMRGGEPVDELLAGGERHLTWEEATERELGPGPVRIAAGEESEQLPGGAVVRSWRALEGAVDIASEELRPGLRRLTVTIANTTPWEGTERHDALRSAMCSTHTVLRARGGGAFVSLTDPPEELREEAAACANEHTWPVLAGPPGERDVLLSSPIILEDHPRVAPESPGDLFDGGEIDALLTLNILAMTDAEKDEMRASDPRVRAILERTEGLSAEQMARLREGAVREFREVRR
jgi:hypothetical protein